MEPLKPVEDPDRPSGDGWWWDVGRRWARVAGAVLLAAAVLAMMVGGMSVMGDPAPGQEAALDPAKQHNMSVTMSIVVPLAVAGSLLLAIAARRRRPSSR